MSRLTSVQPEMLLARLQISSAPLNERWVKSRMPTRPSGSPPTFWVRHCHTTPRWAKSQLNKQEIEAVNLVVSEVSGCDYCLAAHTLTGKMAGYSVEQIKALRRGEFPEDPHIDALVKFVKTLVTTRNTLPEETVSRFLAAGFSDRQVVEVISAVSAILFTNMVNRVNDTVVDFPKVN
ncbi:macrophage infectivity potentiator-related protein [Klebsiella michiganensis]|nr:macrophage infectivity potentiator-related protein [Klebsiella michiganensis]